MNSRAAARGSSPRAKPLDRGREAFRKQEWGAAVSELSAADAESPLEPEDLALLAQAALLMGKDAEGLEILARAHQAFYNRGDIQKAARSAFWLGFRSLFNGEMAQASGWLSRAGRLVEGCPECAEHGYLLLPVAIGSFHSGNVAAAHAAFVRAGEIGERFGEKDLATLALQGQGRTLIRQGEISKGVTLLDEAMVAVTTGEVSALTAGGVYCSVLDACSEIFDLRRAQEWTAALENWCASQPDLVPYRGNCLVHRAEFLQLHGDWAAALDWAQRAAEWLSHPHPKPEAAAAFSRVGDIQRLRGRFAESEAAYRQAGQWSRKPELGLAQLQLAQGRVEAASASIRRPLAEIEDPGPRSRVLDAYVEIALAAGDVAAARAAAQELAEISARLDVLFVRALSRGASGAVLLAEGFELGAMTELRHSWEIWCELQAPYEAARAQVLLAQAYRALGEQENAAAELDAAARTFERLGAPVDLARVEALMAGRHSKAAGPLTERELQVLRLVASGLTNRAIAGKLKISEKTVARHLSNIFTKLDLSSRTALAAYAYEHHLV